MMSVALRMKLEHAVMAGRESAATYDGESGVEGLMALAVRATMAEFVAGGVTITDEVKVRLYP